MQAYNLVFKNIGEIHFFCHISYRQRCTNFKQPYPSNGKEFPGEILSMNRSWSDPRILQNFGLKMVPFCTHRGQISTKKYQYLITLEGILGD